jgi:hypothetical protein
VVSILFWIAVGSWFNIYEAGLRAPARGLAGYFPAVPDGLTSVGGFPGDDYHGGQVGSDRPDEISSDTSVPLL